MDCPSCGARILDGASFCDRCGHQVGIAKFGNLQFQQRPKKDNKVLSIIVLVIVVFVIVPIVLSAVLYFMVLGFGGTSTQTPTSSLMKSSIMGGCKFTFAPMSADTAWGEVTIILSDGYNTVEWSPMTPDLTSGASDQWIGGPQSLGTLEIFANVTDLVGNGFINQGDYFTLTAGGGLFSPATTYSVTVVFDPSSAAICHADFTG